MSLLVAQDLRLVAHPHSAAVMGHDAVLQAELTLLGGLRFCSHHALAVFRV